MAEEKVPFKKSQVKLAVSALLAFVNKEQEGKKKTALFDSQQGLWLSVGLRKIPATQVKPCLVPLPHPHRDEMGEVCFISSKPGKELKKTFEEKSITNVHKIISLTKLRKEYKTFTLKRDLVSSYDVFLCEEKIYHLVCKALGKACYKQKKEPIPVRMRYTDMKKEVDKCLSSALLRIGHGPNSALLIGNVEEQKEKDLLANLLHAMRIVGKKMPGKWDNIKSMYLKTSTSVALPLYQASPVAKVNLDDVKSDESSEKKRRRRKRKVDASLKNADPEKLEENDEEVALVDDVTLTLAETVDNTPTSVEQKNAPEVQSEAVEEEEPKPKKKKVASKKSTKMTASKDEDAIETETVEEPVKKKKKVVAKKPSKVTERKNDGDITIQNGTVAKPIQKTKKVATKKPSKVTEPNKEDQEEKTTVRKSKRVPSAKSGPKKLTQ